MRALAVAWLLVACGSSSSPSSSSSSSSESTARDDRREVKAKSEDGDDRKREAKEVILAVNGHVIALKSQSSFGEYREVVQTFTQQPEVVAAAPFIFAEVVAGKEGKTAPALVKGFDAARNTRMLDRYVVRGTLHTIAADAAPPAIVLGDALADALGARMGDRIQLTLPIEPSDAGDGGVPRSATFLVGGILHTGFEEYDQRLALTGLAAMQRLEGRGDRAMGVEGFVRDPATSDKVAKAIETALGGAPYAVQDWFELNRAFFGTRD
ncbi:MAG: ABC transporter permease [Deltaproteobacteria bacterium]|nr:ABC transporter permease [Deltaproteobacteria bacterium]